MSDTPSEPALKKPKTEHSFFKRDGKNEDLVVEGNATRWTNICENDLNISFAVVLNTKQCSKVFEDLEKEVEYLTGALAQVRVYGRLHNIPRQHSAYGDPGVRYRYSGITVAAKPWTPTLARMRDLVESLSGHSYNFVLINKYKDGKDKMGDHKDDEKELDNEVPIASLSFGAERDFVLKHSDRKRNGVEAVKLLLKPGMMLLMHSPTNSHWIHGIPARTGCKEPRINLTFRHIVIT